MGLELGHEACSVAAFGTSCLQTWFCSAGLYVALPGDFCVNGNNTAADPSVVCSTQAPVCDVGFSGKCIALPENATQPVPASSGPSECAKKWLLYVHMFLQLRFEVELDLDAIMCNLLLK